jgi:hypothetical protein
VTVAESTTAASLQPLTERIAGVLEEAGNHPGSGFPAGFTYRELARLAYETGEPTPAQLSAVRRSVARLVATGRAERDHNERHFNGEGWHERSGGGRHYTARNPGGVEIRRAMTPADHEAREKASRPFRERVEARRAATPYTVDTGSGLESIPIEPVLLITEDGVELREPQEGRS